MLSACLCWRCFVDWCANGHHLMHQKLKQMVLVTSCKHLAKLIVRLWSLIKVFNIMSVQDGLTLLPDCDTFDNEVVWHPVES